MATEERWGGTNISKKENENNKNRKTHKTSKIKSQNGSGNFICCSINTADDMVYIQGVEHRTKRL